MSQPLATAYSATFHSLRQKEIDRLAEEHRAEQHRMLLVWEAALRTAAVQVDAEMIQVEVAKQDAGAMATFLKENILALPSVPSPFKLISGPTVLTRTHTECQKNEDYEVQREYCVWEISTPSA
jgi:hypothetical protein